MTSQFEKENNNNEKLTPREQLRHELREKLSAEVKSKLESDAFWARDFFKAAEAASKKDSPDTAAIFNLLTFTIGDHEDEVKKIVGSKTEDVFSFVGEVISGSDELGK